MKTKLKLVICTTNKSKSDDIKYIINEFKVFESNRFEYEVMNLSEFTDIDLGDAPETCDTVRGNAKQKVDYYHDLLSSNGLLKNNVILISEDTGLFIDALDGAPGVKTARFSGVHDYRRTNEAILNLMEGKKNRYACIKSSISIASMGYQLSESFEESIRCKIAREESKTPGFAFDTIVSPIGCNNCSITYSELGSLYSKDHRVSMLPRTYAVLSALEYIENNY